MRPYALFYFYRRRLRVHAAQELFAGIGIAVAVALVLAATVAEGSIAGATREVVRAVIGPATLQLRARSANGFDERLLGRVEHIAGVRQAAPLLEQTATVVGPHGRRVTVDVAGTVTSLAVLNGLAHTLPIATLSPGGIGLSRAGANALGVTASSAPATQVSLRMRGRATSLKVSAVLGPEAVGALSRSLVAVMPLAEMQRLAGLQGRITRILVQTQPGRQAAVRGELERVAAGRLTVAPADQDVALLRQALRPSDLASGLFAAIGALLGFLIAFNAILLTVPERRQAIADLRVIGTGRLAIVQMVLFQALCLGLAASLAGLLIGYALSVWVFHQPTGYLAQAFTLGKGAVVGARPLILSFAGGVFATLVASAVPLLDLRRGRPRDAVYKESGAAGNTLGIASQWRLFAGAMSLLVAATALFVFLPSAAIVATALLALATVLAVPLVFAGVLNASHFLVERWQTLTILPVALASLRATTLRSLALAATGAVALFGSVALGGSREDLLHGIQGVAHSYAADANVWVTSPRDNQATGEFVPDHYLTSLARIPGVANVRAFQGSFFDLGNRRPWVIARPPDSSPAILSGQIIDGDAAVAAARIREGGWVAVSKQIATEHHVGVGGTLALPTPTGIARLKVAATMTNFAWPTGVIFINTTDYTRYWATAAPTALGVDLLPGADAARVQAAIAHGLGPGSGLEVSSQLARQRKIETSAGEGLGQLAEISTLLLLAAILAMAAALTSAIWQRRVSLAGLRLSGVRPARLRRILLVESVLILGAGCVTGALAGVYGQVIVDGYLKQVTGFPVASVAVSARPLEVLALVLAGALAAVAIPGWLGSRVSPALALEHE
jgi:putative ABC transport system permease protein